MHCIEHKRVKYPIFVSDWFNPIDCSGLVINVVIVLIIVAKNGKRFMAQFASFGKIDGDYLKAKGKDREEIIKKIKYEYCIDRIRDELDGLIGSRRGFAGMREYFKVIEALPYEKL